MSLIDGFKKLFLVTDSADMQDHLLDNMHAEDVKNILVDLDYTPFRKDDKENIIKMCQFRKADSAFEIVVSQLKKFQIRIEEETYKKIAELGEAMEFEENSWYELKNLVLTGETVYPYAGSTTWKKRCDDYRDVWLDCWIQDELTDKLKGCEDIAKVVYGIKGEEALEWIEVELPVLDNRSIVDCVGTETDKVRGILI